MHELRVQFFLFVDKKKVQHVSSSTERSTPDAQTSYSLMQQILNCFSDDELMHRNCAVHNVYKTFHSNINYGRNIHHVAEFKSQQIWIGSENDVRPNGVFSLNLIAFNNFGYFCS